VGPPLWQVASYDGVSDARMCDASRHLAAALGSNSNNRAVASTLARLGTGQDLVFTRQGSPQAQQKSEENQHLEQQFHSQTKFI
jgi:alkylated DNA nucleotide flippase Atl1